MVHLKLTLRVMIKVVSTFILVRLSVIACEHDKTKNSEYLSSVKKAFKFYRKYWRENKNMAFVPRHSAVYSRLFEHTRDKEVAQFVFEMNDWLIKNHQVMRHQYKDMVGGFSKKHPDSRTSIFAEGINDAYALAVLTKDIKRQSSYRNSLRKASQFILRTQYTPENTFYLRAQRKQ